MEESGLYIVTLKNQEPISVNAQDKRIADKAIKVTSKNCKFGKARIFKRRKKDYEKVFGIENVTFHPIVAMLEIELAEREVLTKLDKFRVRGKTGRKNEWLQGISPEDVYSIALSTLCKMGLEHTVIQNNFNKIVP